MSFTKRNFFKKRAKEMWVGIVSYQFLGWISMEDHRPESKFLITLRQTLRSWSPRKLETIVVRWSSGDWLIVYMGSPVWTLTTTTFPLSIWRLGSQAKCLGRAGWGETLGPEGYSWGPGPFSKGVFRKVGMEPLASIVVFLMVICEPCSFPGWGRLEMRWRWIVKSDRIASEEPKTVIVFKKNGSNW
jgi:hypothetical protein